MLTYWKNAIASLLLISTIAGHVESSPQSLVGNNDQFNPDSLSNEDLFGCLQQSVAGNDCNLFQPSTVIESQGCQCVKEYQCLDIVVPGAGTGLGTGPGTGPGTGASTGSFLSTVNVRTLSPTCDDPFDVCCIDFDLSLPNPNPTRTNPNKNNSPITQDNPCGILNVRGLQTTLLGFQENQAQFGQFPWMAAIMTTSIPGTGGENVYVSGGSLIHKRVIMTAAHYMTDKIAEDLAVRIGEWNFKEASEPLPHQDIRVNRIAIHPRFNPNLLEYDVALLFLDTSADLSSPSVGLVCLPEPFEKFEFQSCYVSGWGKASFGNTEKYSQILKAIVVPTETNEHCQDDLRNTRLGPDFNLHETFMCAGGRVGNDACTGDGGSPLVCAMKQDPSRYAQAGIVAWGIGCGQDSVPGVYADVGQAVEWINRELGQLTDFDIRVPASFRPDVRSPISK